MAKKKKKYSRRKRRRVFIIEMIVLVILTAVLFVTVWATHKFSLINHQDVDTEKLYTSDQAQQTRPQTGSPGTEVASGTVVETEPEQVVTEEPQQPVEENALSGYDVFALAGIDSRPDEADIMNSDTMIICVLNHNEKTIRLCSVYRDTYLNIMDDPDPYNSSYNKANSAYCLGGATEFLSMLNYNLDLSITEYMTVNFLALAETIDLLGGLDIEMTREEVVHLNNYNIETSAVCGVPYEEIPLPDASEFDGYMTRTFHCNGTQAVSYARIRYTSGNDFRRASRQREVLRLVKEKASQADWGTLDAVLNAVLPDVTTNIDNMKLFTLATAVLTYRLDEEDQAGFPFVLVPDDGSITGTDCIIPITLEYNVRMLHEFLFPGVYYEPSYSVQDASYVISMRTGYGEAAIEEYSQVDYGASIPRWWQEGYEAEIARINQGLEEGEYYPEEDYSGDGY